MCKKFLITIIAFLSSLMVEASEILVEAESFHQKGGWVVDQQFMDLAAQLGAARIDIDDRLAVVGGPAAGDRLRRDRRCRRCGDERGGGRD